MNMVPAIMWGGPKDGAKVEVREGSMEVHFPKSIPVEWIGRHEIEASAVEPIHRYIYRFFGMCYDMAVFKYTGEI